MSRLLIKRADPKIEPEGWTYIRVGRTFAKIDWNDYQRLKGYHYRLKRSGSCFYAVRVVHRFGKIYYIRIHREIAHTPPGYECHHINHDTLDNRRSNLKNLPPKQHSLEHGRCR